MQLNKGGGIMSAQANDIASEEYDTQDFLVFTVSGHSFGIGIDAVAEIMRTTEPSPAPLAHPCVEGIISPRGEMYTVIDLAKFLELPAKAPDGRDVYIMMRFASANLAFHVHGAEGIFQIPLGGMEKPDTFSGGSVVSGVVNLSGKIVSILAFEKIATHFVTEE
jgi:chemotaxis signal transduction protein